MKREPRFSGPPPGARNVDNGGLYMIAFEAAKKITAPPREGGENDALVSIVFSVITLESFLNEAREFAGHFTSGRGADNVTMFTRAMKDLEQTQSITLKLAVSHLDLSS